jgi:hypothetical protein
MNASRPDHAVYETPSHLIFLLQRYASGFIFIDRALRGTGRGGSVQFIRMLRILPLELDRCGRLRQDIQRRTALRELAVADHRALRALQALAFPADAPDALPRRAAEMAIAQAQTTGLVPAT